MLKTTPHPGGTFLVCRYTADALPEPLSHKKVAVAEYNPANDKSAGRALAKVEDNFNEFDDREEEKLKNPTQLTMKILYCIIFIFLFMKKMKK